MAEPAHRGTGRPRLPDSVKYIWLRESVFTLWRQNEGILASAILLTVSLPNIRFIEGIVDASFISLYVLTFVNFIFCRLLNFLQEVFSYLLWFFFRLGPVTEVNSPCSPVQAQVESGKFLMCYISQLKVCSLCLCESKPFFFL